MPSSPTLPAAAPDSLWAWSPFGVHQEMWSQCLAIQAALLAPWTAWQTAWLEACGLPAETLPNWFSAVVGGEPLP